MDAADKLMLLGLAAMLALLVGEMLRYRRVRRRRVRQLMAAAFKEPR